MLSDLGSWLLPRLDDAVGRLHRFVRAWRATLEGECWSELEAAGCADSCGDAA